MDLKNYQNFTLSNLCYLLPIQKSFELKQQFDHQFDSNSYRIILNSMIFLRRCIGL